MECISCEQADVFNRVVRNQVRGENLGLFCEDCEAEAFGELLETESWHQDNGCAFCDGAGKYQLPKLECLIESETGEPRIIEFSTFEYTASLCKAHLQELLPRDTILEDLTSEQVKSGKVEA